MRYRSNSSKTMPLTSFRKWLANEGKSPGTIETYAFNVRGVFRSPEEARELTGDPKRAEEAILAYASVLPVTTQKVFRASMRAFDAFVVAGGKASILPNGFPKEASEEPTEKHPLTPWLREIGLKSRIPWERVAALKWRHVKGDGEARTLEIDDPGWHRSYVVPTESLRQINLWAGGGEFVKERDTTPIVPREPLSKFPMPAAILRKLARG